MMGQLKKRFKKKGICDNPNHPDHNGSFCACLQCGHMAECPLDLCDGCLGPKTDQCELLAQKILSPALAS